jgi:hypothetical protein
MEATRYSETLHLTTRRYKPEDRNLHNNSRENLKSNVLDPIFHTILVLVFIYCTQNVTLYAATRCCKDNATNTSHCVRVTKQILCKLFLEIFTTSKVILAESL